MIIQIRGTSGSGKSTAMRRVIDGLEWQSEYRPGRKKPLYMRSLNAQCRVVVLGHYDSLCGGCDTIGSARAVYELTQELKVVMMDDDLRFYERVNSSSRPIPLKKAENVLDMISSLDRMLDKYAHCSVSSRTQNAQLSRSDDSRYVENTRPYRIYAYRTDILKKEKIGYSTGQERFTMDDFFVTLALLTKGYAISVDCRFAHEQISSNSAGGASSYRTLQSHEDSAVTLAQKFPKFVKVVKKSTTNSWGGTKTNPVERSDVVIQWKKAYLSASPKPVGRPS